MLGLNNLKESLKFSNLIFLKFSNLNDVSVSNWKSLGTLGVF